MIFVSTTGNAQSEIKFLEIFGEEDLIEITDLLSETVTVCINDEVKEVNRKSAINGLSKFISTLTIKGKKIIHNGKSRDKGSSYKVARIRTNKGVFRVFAYSEKEGNLSLIKEIRIDKI